MQICTQYLHGAELDLRVLPSNLPDLVELGNICVECPNLLRKPLQGVPVTAGAPILQICPKNDTPLPEIHLLVYNLVHLHPISYILYHISYIPFSDIR